MLARKLLGALSGAGLRYVGSAANGSFGTADLTVSLTSLSGGIDTAARVGDIVIAAYSRRGDNLTLSITDGTTEYSLIGSQLFSDDTHDTNLRVAYKVLTAEDPSVTFVSAGASGLIGGIAYVFRGVNGTTPLDVAPTTATGINVGVPNPPAITPVTSGAKILVVGAAAASSTLNEFTASHLSNFVQRSGDGLRSAIGWADWVSGEYNPASFGGGSTSTSASWAAVSLALRPA